MTPASVRYIVEDVAISVDFYTRRLWFTIEQDARTAFASVARGPLRLLLSGTASSGARRPDGRRPVPGGWNRILLHVEDLKGEVERLKGAGLPFRNEVIIRGIAGSQILLEGLSGNVIELFQPAAH
jgi:hypothetical protein